MSAAAGAVISSNMSLSSNHSTHSERSNAFSVAQSVNPLTGVGGSILSGDSVNGDEAGNDKINDRDLQGSLKNLSLKSSPPLDASFNGQRQAQGHGQGRGQSVHNTANVATNNNMRQAVNPVQQAVVQVEIPGIYNENDSLNNTHQRHNHRTNSHNNSRPMTSTPLSHTVSSTSHLHPHPNNHDKISPLVPQTFTLLRKATTTKLLDKRGKYHHTHTFSTHPF